MSLSVLHYSGLSLISLLDSLSGSYSSVNLSSFPETETVCQSSCLLFQQVMGPGGYLQFYDLKDLEDQSPTGHWQACTKPRTISNYR